MSAETRFVAAEDGSPWVETFTEKGIEFFRFETRTAIAIEAGSVTIRTRRRMAAGLLEYFRKNETFRALVMRQNQQHAIDFFEGAA